MKRIFITILTICCIISSVSANSLLFTPHHVSTQTKIFSNDIFETGMAGHVSFHVDADGKTQSTLSTHHSLLKLQQPHPFIYLNASTCIEHLGIGEKGILLHVPPGIYSLKYKKTILFPFHSFL